MQITLLKYINTNLLKNLKPIYYSDCRHGDNSLYTINNINEMYNQMYYVKLGSWGDYQINIFKIEKPNLMLSNIFENIFDSNVVMMTYKHDDPHVKSEKEFIDLFGRAQIFDQNKNVIYDGTEWYSSKILKNIYYSDIDPHKIIFKKIFGLLWNDVKNYKLVHSDGNFMTYIMEVDNFYYVINQDSS